MNVGDRGSEAAVWVCRNATAMAVEGWVPSGECNSGKGSWLPRGVIALDVGDSHGCEDVAGAAKGACAD